MDEAAAACSWIWVPNAGDRLEHAVPDHEVVAAGTAGRSRVTAVCAAPVQLCSLATPPGRRCGDCEAAFDRARGVDATRAARWGAGRWLRRA